MATSRYRMKYILMNVLQALRKAPRGSRPVTAGDIVEWMRARHYNSQRWIDIDPTMSDEDVVSDFLHDLQVIGFATSDAAHDGERSSKEIRWKLNPDWAGGDGNGDAHGDDVSRGNRGNETPPPGQNPPGGDDGDGLGGFGEVLAHPYLFTVSPVDLSDAIDRALGESP